MENLLEESKQFRETATERETINNLLRTNELKRQELLGNLEIGEKERAIELAYLERLHSYWREQLAKYQ